MSGLSRDHPGHMPSDVYAWLASMRQQDYVDIIRPHATDLPHPQPGTRQVENGPVNTGDP